MDQQTGSANLNAQGDINIGGHVAGRDMVMNINYEAAAPGTDSYIPPK